MDAISEEVQRLQISVIARRKRQQSDEADRDRATLCDDCRSGIESVSG